MEQSNLPKHILVFRTSAMGDVAMLPHAIRALHAVYPEVKVTVATRKLFEPFFAGLDVDFMPINPSDLDSFKGLWRFVRSAVALGIDAVADMHHVWRSMFVRRLLQLHGIRSARIHKGKIEKWFRVGYSKSDAVPLKHTVSRYCDVFRRLGFTFPDPAPVAERPLFENPMGEKHGTWVGFAPFSAHEGKTYPAALREQVVARLSARYERVFIHSGGGAELQFAEEMEAKYENVTALFSRLKLAEEMALISKLDCVVSMDSLVMHLCSLTATPVVTVWGATHPELGFLGYGADTEAVLQQEMPCRPCSTYGKKPCRYGDYRCMHAITPQMIEDCVARTIDKNAEKPEK